jgi:predicted nucleic acid-binding Zn ribbon protein
VPSPEDESTLQRVEGPTALGSELSRLLRRSGWSERLAAAQLTAHWHDIVGADLVPHCEPVRLAGRILVVRAATPTWATQLRYLTLQLTERVEAVLGPGTVKDVRIVVGPLEDRG